MHICMHMYTHTHIESILPEVRYATVEVFLNRGLRVNGDIGSVLTAQLSSGTTKTHVDERGWYDYHSNLVTIAIHSFCLNFVFV